MSYSFRVSMGEMDWLHGVTGRAAKLYFVLRSRMDFKTGFVGYSRRVSNQMLYEALEEIPPVGSHKRHWQPTRGELRQLVIELVRAGLVEKVPNEGKGVAESLVFFLPLAKTDLSGFEEVQPRNNQGEQPRVQPEEQPKVQPRETHTEQGLQPEVQPEVQPEEQSEVQPRNNQEVQPTSGYPVYTTTTTAPADVFLMSIDWQPSRTFVDRLRWTGINPDLVNPETLLEFTTYWMGRGESLNQVQWENKFLKSLQHQKTKPKPETQQDEFIARHTDSSWAEGL